MIDLSSFIKVRCGTATEWLTSTYKLGKAELGFDETNRFLKVGDGKTLWANLPVLGGNLGVTSFGGKQGDILLGAGLTMSDNTLKLISPDVTNFVEAYENNFNFNGKTVTFTVVNYTPPASGPSYYNWRVMFANGYRIEGYAGGGMSLTAYNPYAGQSENIYEMSGGTLPKSYTFRDGQGDIGINCIITGFYASNNGTDYIPITPEEFSEWIQITFENMKPSSAKTLNTSGSAGLTPSESESLGGTGVIYLHKISKTGSYNDLLNKPTIPTVNNGTLTLKAGSTRITFTANQSTNVTFNVTASSLGALTATKSINTDNITAQEVSASESTSGSGTINLHRVAKTGSYSDLSNKPTIPIVNNGKLTLKAGSNSKAFTANQSSAVTFEVTAANLGAVTQVKINGSTKSPDDAGLVDLGTISGGGGSSATHEVTKLTNENLNNVKTVGWYSAASGNTCTNRPSGVNNNSFSLKVDSYGASGIMQTIRSAAYSNYWWVRFSDTGSSWNSWVTLQGVTNSSQTFAGTKTFSNQVTLNGPLATSGGSNISNYLLMSRGSSRSPMWVNLRVKVNGTEYTPDSTGLIDLGTISGGTTTVMASTNLVY